MAVSYEHVNKFLDSTKLREFLNELICSRKMQLVASQKSTDHQLRCNVTAVLIQLPACGFYVEMKEFTLQ